ncbi:MAG: EthD family reductase [Rhodococcus sp. (in: high G+C Gram-positive bacteria)]|uniref:EthD family reductase n=1 Tax=Rhodococcus sp. TaxID=1831 RepID=UPI001219B4BA|nr:EthD family reductase [Rhodococcus sp. (in: high G+C Gram-positive bacteria)]RZL24636.1 MAG: EthD family reductase [Rhodococcus sp. (in: high G+C Gram-positive bacteria)]
MSVKVVALIKAHPDVTTEDFLRHWQVEHPKFVWELPELERYVQNPAIEHRKSWPFDGMAELYFPSVEAVAVAFATPAADALREHEAKFIGELTWFLADEVPVERLD